MNLLYKRMNFINRRTNLIYKRMNSKEGIIYTTNNDNTKYKIVASKKNKFSLNSMNEF